MAINPAIRRFPQEAAIIGRLLLAFGELELSICRNAGQAVGMLNTVFKVLYRLRSTSSRIDAADALMQSAFDKAGMTKEYQIALDMVRHCLKIRNQFAHCNYGDWTPNPKAGLFFADLQVSAESPTGGFEHALRHIDAPLLQLQEAYIDNTMEWLEFINHELAVKQGRLESHAWPRPPEQDQPPLHNPPAQHIPPWLNEDQKALHLARALAAQGGPPTPTPKQQALYKARAEKRARSQADRDREAARLGGSPGDAEKPPNES
jgi:hypothetical protein